MKTIRNHILIIAISLISTHAHASLIDDLNNMKKQLSDAAAQVPPAEQQIKDTHQTFQNSVVTPITNALKSLNDQKKGVQDALNQINGIPGPVAGLLAIGDLPNALRFILDHPIKTIETTLTSIKNSFTDNIKDLDPATDPSGIYKDFAQAKTGFDNALNELSKVIQAVQDL